MKLDEGPLERIFRSVKSGLSLDSQGEVYKHELSLTASAGAALALGLYKKDGSLDIEQGFERIQQAPTP